jgi:hypothetical protein
VVIVAFAVSVVAFFGGLYVARRVAPPLSSTRTGRVAARVVDLLGGAAAVALAANAYLIVRFLTSHSFPGYDLDTTVSVYLIDALWEAGLLIAAAAAVHLLAPAAEDGEGEADAGDDVIRQWVE